MTVLVTGATGTVGREVVRGLLERGASVRALTRDPATADLDARVEVIAGDLTDLGSVAAALVGVTAVHLITFTATRGAGGGEALTDATGLVDALRTAGVARVTVLQNGYPGPVEQAVQASDLGWTLLQPVEFMHNALEWADPIRTTDAIEEPYVERLSAMVHEGDIGDVAAVALTAPGYERESLVITGPQVLTVRDKLDAIATARGADVGLVALTAEQAVERWTAQGYDEETIGFFQWIYGNPPEVGTTVADTVTRVTGQPGRTFAAWARDHASAFGGATGAVG